MISFYYKVGKINKKLMYLLRSRRYNTLLNVKDFFERTFVQYNKSSGLLYEKLQRPHFNEFYAYFHAAFHSITTFNINSGYVDEKFYD